MYLASWPGTAPTHWFCSPGELGDMCGGLQTRVTRNIELASGGVKAFSGRLWLFPCATTPMQGGGIWIHEGISDIYFPWKVEIKARVDLSLLLNSYLMNPHRYATLSTHHHNNIFRITFAIKHPPDPNIAPQGGTLLVVCLQSLQDSFLSVYLSLFICQGVGEYSRSTFQVHLGSAFPCPGVSPDVW